MRVNQAIWQAVLGEIETSVSHAVFITWFKPTELVTHPNGSFSIAVPNVFAKQQFESKFNPQVIDALQKNGVTVDTVEYIIKTDSVKRRPADTSPLAEIVATRPTTKKTPKRTDSLNPKYTFDNFVVGSSNDLAYAAAQAVKTVIIKSFCWATLSQLRRTTSYIRRRIRFLSTADLATFLLTTTVTRLFSRR